MGDEVKGDMANKSLVNLHVLVEEQISYQIAPRHKHSTVAVEAPSMHNLTSNFNLCGQLQIKT